MKPALLVPLAASACFLLPCLLIQCAQTSAPTAEPETAPATTLWKLEIDGIGG